MVLFFFSQTCGMAVFEWPAFQKKVIRYRSKLRDLRTLLLGIIICDSYEREKETSEQSEI